MPRCLIDADVIAYQISACGQHKDEYGQLHIHEFDSVADMADGLIREIEEGCLATEPSIIFFTSDERLIRVHNRFSRDEPLVHIPNFRHVVAVSRPYKGNRQAEKPYHFHNLRSYLISQYDYRIGCGLEADDLICIELGKNPDYIACSRDKDLRMVPGRHFTWACGKQQQEGPTLVTELGELWLETKADGKNKLRGNGGKFFWSQMITGDNVDNIPGLPKCGDKKAYDTLAHLQTLDECREAVINLYKERGFDREYFQEQKTLLWIMRSEDERVSLEGNS